MSRNSKLTPAGIELLVRLVVAGYVGGHDGPAHVAVLHFVHRRGDVERVAQNKSHFPRDWLARWLIW